MRLSIKYILYVAGLFFLLFSTDVLAFPHWTSADPWGLANIQFTTEADAVVFNVASTADPDPHYPLKWYDPDGNEVDDSGTGHIWINHFIGGLKVGHYGSM